MNLFDVYPLFDVEIVRGEGCHVYDSKGTEYLDLYGGHAVISVGHSHPHYVDAIKRQAEKLVFYSNSVHNSLQGAHRGFRKGVPRTHIACRGGYRQP